MNIENEFIIVLLNPEICQCVWKIFFLFLFFYHAYGPAKEYDEQHVHHI